MKKLLTLVLSLGLFTLAIASEPKDDAIISTYLQGAYMSA